MFCILIMFILCNMYYLLLENQLLACTKHVRYTHMIRSYMFGCQLPSSGSKFCKVYGMTNDILRWAGNRNHHLHCPSVQVVMHASMKMTGRSRALNHVRQRPLLLLQNFLIASKHPFNSLFLLPSACLNLC